MYIDCKCCPFGVNLTVQDLLRLDARIQDLYFNISEIKISITSLYIISEAPNMTLFGLKTTKWLYLTQTQVSTQAFLGLKDHCSKPIKVMDFSRFDCLCKASYHFGDFGSLYDAGFRVLRADLFNINIINRLSHLRKGVKPRSLECPTIHLWKSLDNQADPLVYSHRAPSKEFIQLSFRINFILTIPDHIQAMDLIQNLQNH